MAGKQNKWEGKNISRKQKNGKVKNCQEKKNIQNTKMAGKHKIAGLKYGRETKKWQGNSKNGRETKKLAGKKKMAGVKLAEKQTKQHGNKMSLQQKKSQCKKLTGKQINGMPK